MFSFFLPAHNVVFNIISNWFMLFNQFVFANSFGSWTSWSFDFHFVIIWIIHNTLIWLHQWNIISVMISCEPFLLPVPSIYKNVFLIIFPMFLEVFGFFFIFYYLLTCIKWNASNKLPINGIYSKILWIIFVSQMIQFTRG